MERQPQVETEDALAIAFIRKSKIERVRGLLRNEKARIRFIAQLPHFSDFDERYCSKIAPDLQNAESILNILRAKGAGKTCYAVSRFGDCDQRVGPLEDMITAIVGRRPGTILSCVEGRLAYYEGEALRERYILERD